MPIDNIMYKITVNSDEEAYRYFDRSDDDIVEFIHKVRKTTIRKDLRRHLFLIIRIYLGIGGYHRKSDLPYLMEWCTRLQRIIVKHEL